MKFHSNKIKTYEKNIDFEFYLLNYFSNNIGYITRILAYRLAIKLHIIRQSNEEKIFRQIHKNNTKIIYTITLNETASNNKNNNQKQGKIQDKK